MRIGATNVYDDRFFEDQREESSSSAAVVVPLLHELLRPRSVLDVGCGTGPWVRAWMQLGVPDAIGVDGPYVSPEQLLIPAANYLAGDLTKPLDLNRRFDLVSCLEVAEHLDAAHTTTLLDSLTRHGDVVLFSAAVPGQPGTHHVNCAWQSHWVKLFEAKGWHVLDIVRSMLWNDGRVGSCYRQNLLLFVGPQRQELLSLKTTHSSSMPLDVAHPGLIEGLIRPQGVRLQTQVWLREARWSIRQKLARK
jgi:SAM-dependent methyltransferase